jgi:enterochelin esterase family protein
MVLTKDGTLHIARATPDGWDELVGVPIFDELTWTPPSVAYGDVFARSRSEIVRIDLNGAGTRAVAESDLKVARSLDPGDGEFGRFLRALEGADDPGALIDAFLQEPRDYPIREGDARIHFVYRGEATDLAITGDMLGTRQDVAMVRVPGTDLYYYTADFLPDARLSYAFLRDSEMITDPLNPLVVPTLIYNAEREHVFGDRPQPMSELRMPGWRLADHLREPDAGSRGTVESLEFEDRRGKFELQVYLPHGYEASSARYPVVYYHGPSPTQLSAIPTTLDNLIADGEIQAVIAVWTSVRLGGGPYYAGYWAEEIVPVIDSRYRTVQSAEGRVSVGSGGGSLAGLHIAIEYPEMSSGLALLSIRALDLQWDPLLPRLGTPETRPVRLYVDWGIYGLRNPQEVWDNRIKSAARAQQLRDLGYDVQGGEVIDGVGWASWRNHADAVLRAILPPVSQR